MSGCVVADGTNQVNWIISATSEGANYCRVGADSCLPDEAASGALRVVEEVFQCKGGRKNGGSAR